MHATSYDSMEQFYYKYCADSRQLLKILEVGSQNINGTYRPIFAGHNYTGIDVVAGAGVDVVVKPWMWGDRLKELHLFDVIISGQTLEHDAQWWRTLEQMRLAGSEGTLACIIAPGTSPYHRAPDYYRFMPDAPVVWAELLNAELLESWWLEETPHSDCGGVFKFLGDK